MIDLYDPNEERLLRLKALTSRLGVGTEILWHRRGRNPQYEAKEQRQYVPRRGPATGSVLLLSLDHPQTPLEAQPFSGTLRVGGKLTARCPRRSLRVGTDTLLG